MAHQMHDAGLDGGIREGRIDRIREALEAVHDRDQDVFYAAIAQVVHHREPELSPFVIGNPKAQNLTFTLRGDAQGHVNGLVLNLSAFRIADFDPERIEENDGIHLFQSAVLPVRHFLQNCVSDTADKVS